MNEQNLGGMQSVALKPKRAIDHCSMPKWSTVSVYERNNDGCVCRAEWQVDPMALSNSLVAYPLEEENIIISFTEIQ